MSMTTPLIRQVYRLRSQNNLSKADHFVVIPSYVESQFVYIYIVPVVLILVVDDVI